jgi:hypothetical protein
MAKQYWLIAVDGFDPQVAVGETERSARWAVFSAGKEAGYFGGKDGFRRFLRASGKPATITEAAARAIIGGHKAAGER